MRKAIEVIEFMNTVNNMLATSTKDPNIRQGVIYSLEHILRTSLISYGYRYLLENEVPEGQLPGVYSSNVPSCDDVDTTRRCFYLK